VARRTLIVGCGYLGLAVARALQQRGDRITAWVRSPESAAELALEKFERIIAGDAANSNLWHEAGKFDAVAFCASSGGGGVGEYLRVYKFGSRLMHAYQPEAWRVFISSTSVYGQTDGGWVDETSPTTPANQTSQLLVEAENDTVAVGGIVLRSAGIYGPGRAMLFEKFRRGDAVLEDGGARWINQVHRDDLAAAVILLLDQGAPGQIYNAADDEPVTLHNYYAWCSEKLGKPMPPPGTRDPNRKRGLTNKRVSNKKLHATGWVPVFPTFREGLASELR
jgi:nucleoside-diphosphate-sugar epimerase